MRSNKERQQLLLHVLGKFEFDHHHGATAKELETIIQLPKSSLFDALNDIVALGLCRKEEVWPLIVNVDAMLKAECIRKLKSGEAKYQDWHKKREKRYTRYDELTGDHFQDFLNQLKQAVKDANRYRRRLPKSPTERDLYEILATGPITAPTDQTQWYIRFRDANTQQWYQAEKRWKEEQDREREKLEKSRKHGKWRTSLSSKHAYKHGISEVDRLNARLMNKLRKPRMEYLLTPKDSAKLREIMTNKLLVPTLLPAQMN